MERVGCTWQDAGAVGDDGDGGNDDDGNSGNDSSLAALLQRDPSPGPSPQFLLGLGISIPGKLAEANVGS